MAENSLNEKVRNLYQRAKILEVNDLQAYIREKGTDVNARNDDGASALLLATKDKNASAIRTLGACGADVNIATPFSRTALMIAASNGDLDCVEALVDCRARVDDQDTLGRTALHILIGQVLLTRHKVDCVHALVRAGSNVNVMDGEGKTPLMYSAGFGGDDTFGQIMNMPFIVICDLLDTLEVLLHAGADPNTRDKKGRSALIHLTGYNVFMRACGDRISQEPCLNLIEHNADVNLQDTKGLTALMYASNKGLSRCCWQLLQYNSDVNLRDAKKKTALIHAAIGDSDVCCNLLIKHGADVNAQDEDGRTALMYACFCGSSRSEFHALAERANVNIQDAEGRTALMYAVLHYSIVLNDLIRRPDIDVNMKDKEDMTALMYATTSGCFQTLTSIGMEGQFQKTNYPAFVRLLKDIHILEIFKNTSTSKRILAKISKMLQSGTSPSLDPHHRPYLYVDIPIHYHDVNNSLPQVLCLGSFMEYNRMHLIRLFVCNGVVEIFQKHEFSGRKTCPVSLAIDFGLLDLVRYFVATCYLTNDDIDEMRHFAQNLKCRHWILYKKAGDLNFLHQAMSQPWPLVKLAFIAVSSALGGGPDRPTRISQTQLPPRLQRMLMFQEPVSLLPVSQWADIPLCFDPVQYEKLPRPRPLLYYWPFGRYINLEFT